MALARPLVLHLKIPSGSKENTASPPFCSALPVSVRPLLQSVGHDTDFQSPSFHLHRVREPCATAGTFNIASAFLPEGTRGGSIRFRLASAGRLNRVSLLPDMAAGHGHGHDHGHGKLELPDYRQWKIEGTPLEAVQKRLAERGLRDPWGRNEAWRYMGGFAHNVSFMSVLLKGFKWGFAAFVVALGAEYYLTSETEDKKHH